MAVLINKTIDVDFNYGEKQNVELNGSRIQLLMTSNLDVYETTTAIPKMTSLTSPSGISSSSAELNTHQSWLLFDQNNSTAWWSNNASNEWIAYQFTIPTIIHQYTIYFNRVVSANFSPKSWRFEGSSDGTTWTTLDTKTNQPTFSVSEKRTYDISNTQPFIKYRLYIVAVNGAAYAQIYGIEMMPIINKSVYVQNGTYITKAYDLGHTFRKVNNVSLSASTTTDAEYKLYCSTSRDNYNYSDWSLVNSDETITSEQNRYIKFKIEGYPTFRVKRPMNDRSAMQNFLEQSR